MGTTILMCQEIWGGNDDLTDYLCLSDIICTQCIENFKYHHLRTNNLKFVTYFIQHESQTSRYYFQFYKFVPINLKIFSMNPRKIPKKKIENWTLVLIYWIGPQHFEIS